MPVIVLTLNEKSDKTRNRNLTVHGALKVTCSKQMDNYFEN